MAGSCWRLPIDVPLLLLWVLTVLDIFGYHDCSAKVVTGTVSTWEAKQSHGKYVTAFYFQGESAQIQYEVNTTDKFKSALYLYLDEDWQEARDAVECLHKLQMARVVYDLENRTGWYPVLHFIRPRLWHVVYADVYTCERGRPIQPIEYPAYLQYELRLLNPDSLGNPTDHFGADESGLYRFYQLLTVSYFVIGCIYFTRVWETVHKGGPMELVTQLLSGATCLQVVSTITLVLHLRRYSYDGRGSLLLELLSGLLDLGSQYVMLYMLVSLSLGWTLGHSYKPSSALSKLKERPVAIRIMTGVAFLQGILFLWDQYELLEHQRHYTQHSFTSVSLAILRIFLAAMFAAHLRGIVLAERSSLKKDFYNSFTKCCMVWFLSYPILVLISQLMSQYLRYKFVTLGVVLGQSTAMMMLYRLFLSRSLYWEVSALSSCLPLRMDKTFGRYTYS